MYAASTPSKSEELHDQGIIKHHIQCPVSTL